MSFQVLRIETYKKASLRGLGGETERDGREKAQHKNVDIVKTLSYKNVFLKKSTQGFHKEWQHIMDELNVQSRVNKKSNVVDGMIITSDKAFFEKMGWEKGKAPTPQMKEFFDDAYAWALKEIGFLGTDKNVISAVIHVDEETPHLHLYYLPITEKWREKQYARDENGKILKNGKNPVYLRDENGEMLYEEKTDAEKPRLNRDEFWRVRGGVDSYALMQDRFFDEVAQKWGLERGEKGSKRKHTSKREYEKAQTATAARTVGYIEAIRPHQNVFNRLTGRVTVDKDDFEDLKRQAVAYAEKQPQLERAAEKERDVISREKAARKDFEANVSKETDLYVRELEIKYKEKELEGLSDLPKRLKDTQEKLKTTQRQLEDYKDYALHLYRENQGIDKSAKEKELERRHTDQMRQKEEEHAHEVRELKDQISELEACQQRALDEERRKRKELEKRHQQELKKQNAIIDSLITAVRSMGYVLTSILGWLRGDHHDYAKAAVKIGNSALEDSGEIPDIDYVMPMPRILHQTFRDISDDGGRGL